MSSDDYWLQMMTRRMSSLCSSATSKDKIEINDFLECFEVHTSKVYPVFFGGKGILSGQLASDLDGNLAKIRKHYELNRGNFVTLEDLVSHEVTTRGREVLLKEKDVGVKGLLWLSRTLDFICTLLENLSNPKDRAPKECALETYSATLEPYHGWIGRATFSSGLSFITDEEKLMELFGFEHNTEFEKAATEFASTLRPILKRCFLILEKYEVNFNYKVM